MDGGPRHRYHLKYESIYCSDRVAFFACSAQAGLLIEPMVGGQFSGDLVIPTNVDASNFTSIVYGGRVGLNIDGLLIGGEYLGDDNVDVKVDGPNMWGVNSTALKMSNVNYGGFLGFEFSSPLMMRLIATFFTSSDAHLVHFSATGSTDFDQNLTGYGYKGEISTKIARFLTMGVSYYYLVYTTAKDNMTATSSPAVPVNTQHAVMTHISIPLELN